MKKLSAILDPLSWKWKFLFFIYKCIFGDPKKPLKIDQRSGCRPILESWKPLKEPWIFFSSLKSLKPLKNPGISKSKSQWSINYNCQNIKKWIKNLREILFLEWSPSHACAQYIHIPYKNVKSYLANQVILRTTSIVIACFNTGIILFLTQLPKSFTERKNMSGLR